MKMKNHSFEWPASPAVRDPHMSSFRKVSDENLVPLSALQHFVFCRRQCALIHLEGAWAENRLTAEGRLIHDRVDQARSESRRDLRTASAVRICSRRLGVVGVMDMLEFHRVESPRCSEHRTIAIKLPGTNGL